MFNHPFFSYIGGAVCMIGGVLVACTIIFFLVSLLQSCVMEVIIKHKMLEGFRKNFLLFRENKADFLEWLERKENSDNG